MGFPRFWGRVSAADIVMALDVGEGKRDENGNTPSNGRLDVVWTIAYYVLLVVGAVGWRKLLWTLTESESTLTKF